MSRLRIDEEGRYDLLFEPANPLDSILCACDRSGFCPVHGTYQPAVIDPEILDTLGDLRSRGGRQVIRKKLGE
jgi:hypothetical protein